ncbi:hypothetical protein XENTR_v10022503 [Xenopus tropicalis]|nr:hypothetical protein XENTR_v10003463 [Xenopus tropicalis]KAE8588392.1 hypothetical protein XENTR_v10022503 [Xenopus tropicalis]
MSQRVVQETPPSERPSVANNTLGDWVKVGEPQKATLAKQKATNSSGGNHRKKEERAEGAHAKEGADPFPLSVNRFAPLSWGERAELEEEEELNRELARSDNANSSSSEFEYISPAEAEKLPSGLSAKRECSDDDRKVKRRVETSSS